MFQSLPVERTGIDFVAIDSYSCACAPGWTGMACQRRACPNECSYHGKC